MIVNNKIDNAEAFVKVLCQLSLFDAFFFKHFFIQFLGLSFVILQR